jgi:hypothetical protein
MFCRCNSRVISALAKIAARNGNCLRQKSLHIHADFADYPFATSYRPA